MDPGIRVQFEETRRHVDEVAGELRAQGEETRCHVDELRAQGEETRRHIDEVAGELRAQAEETRRYVGEVAGEVRAQAEETRRHFDVVAEGMHADVRLVAEGVVSLAERVDRVEENLREEIRETRRDLTALITVSYTDLDRRVRRLEDDR